MVTFSAEVVLGGRVITYTAKANDKKEFVRLIKNKVEKKYPKFVAGLQIKQIAVLQIN